MTITTHHGDCLEILPTLYRNAAPMARKSTWRRCCDPPSRHGYAPRRTTLDALGQTWDGWVVEGITPPAAFIGDAGLLAWLDTLDRGRAVVPDEQQMELAI